MRMTFVACFSKICVILLFTDILLATVHCPIDIQVGDDAMRQSESDCSGGRSVLVRIETSQVAESHKYEQQE